MSNPFEFKSGRPDMAVLESFSRFWFQKYLEFLSGLPDLLLEFENREEVFDNDDGNLLLAALQELKNTGITFFPSQPTCYRPGIGDVNINLYELEKILGNNKHLLKESVFLGTLHEVTHAFLYAVGYQVYKKGVAGMLEKKDIKTESLIDFIVGIVFSVFESDLKEEKITFGSCSDRMLLLGSDLTFNKDGIVILDHSKEIDAVSYEGHPTSVVRSRLFDEGYAMEKKVGALRALFHAFSTLRSADNKSTFFTNYVI